MKIKETDYETVTRWIHSLEEDKVLERIKEFVKKDPVKEEVLLMLRALHKGVAGVVETYERGQYFVGEIVCAMEMIAEVESLLMPLAKKTMVREVMWGDGREENLVEELLTFQWKPVYRTQHPEYA